MLKISIGKENRTLLTVGPSDCTDEVDLNEFERLLMVCSDNPEKYWIKVQSEFIWNERVTEVLAYLMKAYTAIQHEKPGYHEITAMLFTLGHKEGTLQQVKGEF